jgi:uncharacterized membrane protein
MSARWIVALTGVVLVVHLLVALLVWPDLPTRVPVHLDLQGEPTRWASTSLLVWLLPWVSSLATVAVILGTVILSRRRPSLWNVPNKQSFLALPAHLRAIVEERLHRLVAWIALLCAVCFIGVHLATFRAAHGASTGVALWALTFLPILAILLVSLREGHGIGDQVRTLAARAASER